MTITELVIIQSNPFLSLCAIQPICEKLWMNGNVSIFDNGTNCESNAAVLNQCQKDGNGPDADNDGVNDFNDNCITVPNPDQNDSDYNGIGDLCRDTDDDGIIDISNNCPNTPNQIKKTMTEMV